MIKSLLNALTNRLTRCKLPLIPSPQRHKPVELAATNSWTDGMGRTRRFIYRSLPTPHRTMIESGTWESIRNSSNYLVHRKQANGELLSLTYEGRRKAFVAK